MPQDEIEIILDLMKFMLQPEQQALTWKAFIGPVDQGRDARQGAAGHPGLVQEHWRPEYTDMDKKYKSCRCSKRASCMIAAFDSWDKEVGARRRSSASEPERSDRPLRFRLTKRFGAKTVLDDFALEVRGRRVRHPARAVAAAASPPRSTSWPGCSRPSEGELWLDGARIDRLPPEQRGFGMVFQNYALFPHLTVFGNIAFGLALRGAGRAAEIAERVSARCWTWCSSRSSRPATRRSFPAASSSASRLPARS